MKNSNLVQVVPDRVSYQYVLNALTNSKTATGASKAYDVLQEMIALYEAGNILVAPNASNFSRVMLALAQNGHGNIQFSLLSFSSLQDKGFDEELHHWKKTHFTHKRTSRAVLWIIKVMNL